MLDGWYCRTIANEQAGTQQEEPNVDVDGESESEESRAKPTQNFEAEKSNGTQIDYKAQYRYLKKKLKFLIYENEFFQDALRSNQRKVLKVSRDRAFLLDRLLQYEKPEDTSDSDATESSEDEVAKEPKKRKADASPAGNNATSTGRGRKKVKTDGSQTKSATVEKTAAEMPVNSIEQQQQENNQQQQQQQHEQQQLQQHEPQQLQQHEQQQLQPGHMTPAEVERHLQSRQSVLELMPEHASATVPTEMFSNEPSLDGEPHDHMIDGSPTHVAAEECVQMEYAN